MARPGVSFERRIRPDGGPTARADVALIAGLVHRRPGPVPAGVAAALEAAGWAGAGPFARSPAAVDALLDCPVAVESWDAFAALFDGDAREVAPGDGRRTSAPLAMAVRSFFAEGGARAWIVRTGDPLPVTDPDATPAQWRAARRRRISLGAAAEAAEAGVMVPLLPGEGGRGTPASARDPATWRGAAHVLGVDEAAMLLLPDLPDLCAPRPAPAVALPAPPPPPEVFRPCGPAATPEAFRAPPPDLSAPRLDAAGWRLWSNALAFALGLLDAPGGAHHRRDVTLVAGLPRPAPGAGDPLDPIGLVAAAEPVAGQSAAAAAWLGSRRLALGYPWLGTTGSARAPEGLESPEGALAGAIARTALAQGAHRSAAGRRTPSVARTSPELDSGALARNRPSGAPGGGSDWAGARVCLFGREPAEGFALLSDATLAVDPDLRAGGVSRLIGVILRAGRLLGRDLVFEPSAEPLWAELQGEVSGMMDRLFRLGAFAGAGPAEAFSVRCDRSTMTQADLDAGRLVAEIDFAAAQPVQRVRVALDLGRAQEARV